jgi:membrane protein implicated in regulation of membrane protease activity
MKRVRRWDPPSEPLPKRPYRDTVLVYGGMAVVIVVVAVLTGGSFRQAAVIAGAFFVIATAWSWRHWRQRLRADKPHEP